MRFALLDLFVFEFWSFFSFIISLHDVFPFFIYLKSQGLYMSIYNFGNFNI